MELHSIIVHRLNKEISGKASLILSDNQLPLEQREIEFVSNIKQVYYKKSNPNYGIFNADAVSFPFQTMLKNYIQNREFLVFTTQAMNHLLAIIDNIPQATGGYVIFAHYTFQSEEFVITVILNNKKQYNINNDLSIEEILSLDIDKLDVANSVNITRWANREETYLSFTSGRKDISNYFKRFIGCTDQTSAIESSKLLKKAILDYLPRLNLDKQAKDDLKNRVLCYCYAQIDKKLDISLGHISSMINADEPNLFQEFASSEDYRVSSIIKGHKKTLKPLKFYVYHSQNLTIEFDSGLIDDTIFFHEEANELKIINVPEDLRRQLVNEQDPE